MHDGKRAVLNTGRHVTTYLRAVTMFHHRTRHGHSAGGITHITNHECKKAVTTPHQSHQQHASCTFALACTQHLRSCHHNSHVRGTVHHTRSATRLLPSRAARRMRPDVPPGADVWLAHKDVHHEAGHAVYAVRLTCRTGIKPVNRACSTHPAAQMSALWLYALATISGAWYTSAMVTSVSFIPGCSQQETYDSTCCLGKRHGPPPIHPPKHRW